MKHYEVWSTSVQLATFCDVFLFNILFLGTRFVWIEPQPFEITLDNRMDFLRCILCEKGKHY